MRVATTLPSATEIVCLLGLEPVAVSHGCDHPPGVERLPSLTASRIDADASSGEIDEQVLEATTEEGVYTVDRSVLESTEPELVVTQGMCDVCAVDDAVIRGAIESSSVDPDVLTTDPHSVADVLGDIDRIAAATGTEGRGDEVRAGLEARIERVRAETADIAPEDRPRVAVFDWTNPVMLAGHWTAELVEWAGGRYDPVDVGERSRPREWSDILAYDPEVIIVGPCGFELEQTAANATDLTERDGWGDLAAVQSGRVWALDGNQYLNRPGPRLVDTLEALAPIIQPDRFPTPPSSAVAVPVDALSAWPEHTHLEV